MDEPRFGNIKTRKEMRNALVELLRVHGVPPKVAAVLNLENKDDRKALCLGLMAAGYTGREVAQRLGLKESSIYSAYHRMMGQNTKERAERRRESEERIEASASAVAEAALAEMAHDIESEEVQLSPGDKEKYFRSANKALERSRGRQAGDGGSEGSRWQEIFKSLSEGGTVTVDVEPRKVIDVGGGPEETPRIPSEA
jgi:predicted transcriptional regulator